MAIARQPEYCPICGKQLKEAHAFKGSDFVGDTFIGYKECKHSDLFPDPKPTPGDMVDAKEGVDDVLSAVIMGAIEQQEKGVLISFNAYNKVVEASKAQPLSPYSRELNFAKWLEENTIVVKEEKITLYRYHDNLDGWGNYTLEDIYIVYKEIVYNHG